MLGVNVPLEDKLAISQIAKGELLKNVLCSVQGAANGDHFRAMQRERHCGGLGGFEAVEAVRTCSAGML